MKADTLLKIYATALTGVVAVLVLGGADAPKSAAFDELDVGRINVREPDGTLRMVVSNNTKFPGAIVRGKSYRHPSRSDMAGMIFYNDEGSESGGLVFNGQEKDGKGYTGGSLTFDRYENDQIIQIIGVQEGDQDYSGVYINDQPEGRMNFAAMDAYAALPPGPERDAAGARINPGKGGANRLFVGKNTDRDSLVRMRDAQGKERLRLQVSAEGEAEIVFLDEDGTITKRIGAN